MHILIILHCVTKINSQSDRVWHAYNDNFALRHKNQFATRNLKSLARLEHSHFERKWVCVLFPWMGISGLRWWHDVWHAHIDHFASRHKICSHRAIYNLLRDSGIHILIGSECMYCFRRWKQVSSNVQIACGMHVLIILHCYKNIFATGNLKSFNETRAFIFWRKPRRIMNSMQMENEFAKSSK